MWLFYVNRIIYSEVNSNLSSFDQKRMNLTNMSYVIPRLEWTGMTQSLQQYKYGRRARADSCSGLGEFCQTKTSNSSHLLQKQAIYFKNKPFTSNTSRSRQIQAVHVKYKPFTSKTSHLRQIQAVHTKYKPFNSNTSHLRQIGAIYVK